jgi:colanic acid biosynthesis glycosyl transferase WcaI
MAAVRPAGLRIAFVCQYFPPEPAPIGVMLGELAADLGAAGHRVTVVTGFPNHPGGAIYPGYRKRLFAREQRGSADIVRCWLYTSPSKRFLPRLANYLSFALTSAIAASRLRDHDLLFIVSPPLSNGLLAVALRKLFGLRYVFNVQDIYPDAAIAAGMIRNTFLIAIARALERMTYRHAEGVAVISEGFRNALQARGVAAGKVAVIPNWLDLEEITPRPRDNQFATDNGLAGKFVVLYSGTIGIISGAEVMLDCAQRLAGRPDILFLFVGEGVVKERLQREAAARGLGNMRFLPFQDRALLPQVQSAADLSVATLRPGQGRSSVPSKVLGYMAAARPVLAGVDGGSDTHRLIEQAGCGRWAAPGDAAALCEAILRIHGDRALGRRMGGNGRRYLETHCSRRTVTAQYARLFERCAPGQRP